MCRINSSLDALAVRINTKLREAVKAKNIAVGNSREFGEALIELKAQLPHGSFLPWLEENTDISEGTAWDYVRIANRWSEIEAKRQRTADLLPYR